MRRWFFVVALVSFACSEPEPDGRSPDLGSQRATPEAPRTRGENFEGDLWKVPIPDGFVQSPELATALVATERRPRAESFLSSIMVNAIPYPDPSMRKDLSDPATCEAESAGVVEIVRSQGLDPNGFESEIIELPVGRACRYRLSLAGETPHVSQGTALQSDRGDFMVVCNIAEGDSRARSGCDELLRGWRWKR